MNVSTSRTKSSRNGFQRWTKDGGFSQWNYHPAGAMNFYREASLPRDHPTLKAYSLWDTQCDGDRDRGLGP